MVARTPLKSMKQRKAPKKAHTANTKFGMGDYYGTGIKVKLGKVRDGIGLGTLSQKKLSKPPRTLA